MIATTANELVMREDDFIVSKTNPKGKITYCNKIFIEFSEFTEIELLGQPHNIIRHPDMPRAVYRLMWKTLQEGNEFNGIVKNRTKTGKFYWTYANATPSYDIHDEVVGYYSVRRAPQRDTVKIMDSLYRDMINAESQHSNATESMDASFAILMDAIKTSGKEYNEYIISLEA